MPGSLRDVLKKFKNRRYALPGILFAFSALFSLALAISDNLDLCGYGGSCSVQCNGYVSDDGYVRCDGYVRDDAYVRCDGYVGADGYVPCTVSRDGYPTVGTDAYVACDGVGCDAYLRGGMKPDLVVDTAEAPATITKGELASFTWTISNIGPSEATAPPWAEGWYDQVYLSADPYFDYDDHHVISQINTSPLAPGESYTAAVDVIVANIASGDYYVIVRSDGWNSVYEADESNNVYVGPLVTVEGEDPDLVITSLNAPAEMIKGEEAQLSWTVENQGAGTAVGAWMDTYYYSADSEFNQAEDTRLGYFYHEGDLAPGENYTADMAALIANIPSGNGYLLVVTDPVLSGKGGGPGPNGTILESNEANNTATMPVSISGPDPDLTPLSLTAPEIVGAGEWMSASWTVYNQGDGKAVTANDWGWGDVLYFSADTELDSFDTPIGQGWRYEELPSGESYWNESLPFFNPIPSVEPGNYYLILKTDSNNNIYESDEANNTLVRPVTVAAPDLTIALESPDIVESGSPFNAAMTVYNQGGGVSAWLPWNGWSDSLYVSSDPYWDDNDSWLDSSWHWGTLPSGDSYSVPVNTIAWMPPGTYYLIAKTDSWNNVPESDESNNVSVRQVVIEPAAGQDYTPPVISNVLVSPTCDGATITWETDEPATTELSWSWSGASGDTVDESPDNYHSANVTGASSDQVVAYTVSSMDEAGNISIWGEVTFSTLPGSKPELALTKHNVYWASYADYAVGLLSVDYRIRNNGASHASSVRVTDSVPTGGVTLLSEMPYDIGSLPGGAAADYTLKYGIPAGVSKFKALSSVSAMDACGGLYTYP